jgi:asparagine synthase (glutamine-hydrolysing)
MCGISGFWDFHARTPEVVAVAQARSMADALTPRGPDDDGVWIDAEAGIALGHRRLSIVDLSPMGSQPMVSRSGRFVLVYNGEVYNHRELRAELERLGISFRGGSDTEVILEACECWGLENTARRLIGMFAFALWDRTGRTLSLVRDRLGIKPLYWSVNGGLLLFGSELKALKTHPAFQARIDRNAVASFINYNYVPAPLSIYENVKKLRQGHILTFSAGREPQESVFWSLQQVIVEQRGRRQDLTDEAGEEELDVLLRDAVGRRMIADVPLGAFLSGGIDSSTVVALMQAQSERPIRTFALGFSETGYDEAVFAKAVAAHLGTDHTEVYVAASDAIDVIPRLPEIYDEPFADSSQIPTYLVSALSRRHVTVALSGDGGDELFGGYSRYLVGRSLSPALNLLRGPVGRTAGRALDAISSKARDRLFCRMPKRFQNVRAAEKLQKLGKVISGGPDQLHQTLVSHWCAADVLTRESAEPLHSFARAHDLATGLDIVERMQYIDAMTCLPDDILAKVDRASMAVSLEVRVPLIDHRVVEFAWSLPSRFRIRDGKTKWLLRKVLERYVPRHMFDRPKMGFGVPVHSWLRGPLRGWAEELLDERCLRDQGFLNPEPIRRRWAQHLSGARDWHEPLWGVLMFQAWLKTHK